MSTPAVMAGFASHWRHKINPERSSPAAIGNAGKLPDASAEKLLAIAKIAYEEFDSDLRRLSRNPFP